jgi:hypothetical protein
MSRFSLAFLALLLAFGPSLAFTSSTRAAAVNCDVNKCISICSKGKVGTAIQSCNSGCQITIADRQKSGQCK